VELFVPSWIPSISSVQYASTPASWFGVSAAQLSLIFSGLGASAPLDPAVYAVVAATLLAVAGLTCILPAYRASRLGRSLEDAEAYASHLFEVSLQDGFVRAL
jgi:hypothetical protein